jgi:hypothetical protein
LGDFFKSRGTVKKVAIPTKNKLKKQEYEFHEDIFSIVIGGGSWGWCDCDVVGYGDCWYGCGVWVVDAG